MAKISDKAVREAWEYWGGEFHGPNIETATIEKKRMFSFAREMYREGIASAKESQSDASAKGEAK
jgi:hypothetical protein